MEWTVKYAPKSMADLVGNKSNYTKLYSWLKNFYLTKPSARSKEFKYITLLVGPPGIGKTSGIIALSKELQFEIVEFNASDQRNEKIISRLVGRETKTHINQGYKGKIVLLDEVDGIQGREDKGGLSALMKLAKESIHPIICTANDPQSDKIRSLKKSPMTITLTFKRPENSEMVTLLKNIAQREEIAVSDKLLAVICNNAHGDIRGAVNDLENLSHERKEIPMNAIQALSIRDSEVSIDLALRQIFGEAKTLRQAHEVTSDLDVDAGMFMQYVVENIPSHSNQPQELSGMFGNAARADLFYGRIMSSQHWKYLKYYYYFLSAGIRSSKDSPYTQSYPKFPSGIMMLSRTKKVRAIRTSVTQKFGKLNHCSKNKINNYSLPYIRLVFEKLFESYVTKTIESDKGQSLLTTVAEMHNEISLEEDEFIYLFNDPLYEKQTAAEEKKQKALMKLIEERAQEIRTEKITSHNKELNQLLSFSTSSSQPAAQSETKPVSKKDSSSLEKPKPKKSQKAPKPVEPVEEPVKIEHQIDSQTTSEEKPVDDFDLEEKKLKRTKKASSKQKIEPEKELSDKKKVKATSSEVDSETSKPAKLKKEKGKQKGLFDFTNPDTKKDSSKKKKDSRNLTDFL